MKKQLITTTLAAILVLSPALAVHAGEASSDRVQVRKLVSVQERAAHRTELKNAATAEERETIRTEFRTLIKQRADEKGITLPENFKVE
ncbi:MULTISPECIES: hypothetical protein [Neptuniibacter]|jgi:hypothetical protein|uniref:hypothetical protein n=1 Tax=Neptuniibacter TaxID=459520 RepID=UPI00082EF4AC|nr:MULTISPECIES: hypothetical protein [Neptuniibacter]MDO6593926.1 hypothetical protein [Neptuniibacter sp. 1_MG-2023]